MQRIWLAQLANAAGRRNGQKLKPPTSGSRECGPAKDNVSSAPHILTDLFKPLTPFQNVLHSLC